MKIIGLTGGIGSGKSTVAKMFKQLGVSIYIADDEAKNMMNGDTVLKNQIIDLFGDQSYMNGKLNRPYIADIVFNDKSKLTALNTIVHPAVAQHFMLWKSKQSGDYVIKEAAILFENGGHKQCDYTILVCAPLEIRIQRVLDRDNSTREQVLSRTNNQWDDSEKIPLADFVINNVNIEKTKAKVYEIHKKISSGTSKNTNISFC